MSDAEAVGPALDPGTIEELRHLQVEYGNPQFLGQLVAIFTTNAPRRMEQLREAVTGLDDHALEHTAHTLKSNCAMLGASRMAALCHELEELGGREAFCEAAAVLEKAEGEFARVMDALAALDLADRQT